MTYVIIIRVNSDINNFVSTPMSFVLVDIPDIFSISRLEYCALLQYWRSSTGIWFLNEASSIVFARLSNTGILVNNVKNSAKTVINSYKLKQLHASID